MRHELIVYRNPVEAWWWDNPEAFLWLIGGVVAVIVVAVLVGTLYNRFRRF